MINKMLRNMAHGATHITVQTLFPNVRSLAQFYNF